MTLPREATLTRAALGTTFNQPRSFAIPSPLRRTAAVVGDLLALAAIALCIPFVILAIGTPLALCVRLVLWVVGVSR